MYFLKTKNQTIVNENEEEIILQGYAVGNWMVQESYLFGCGNFHGDYKPFSRYQGMDRSRAINQAIIETCGSKYAESFWHQYYKNYFSEEDISHLKDAGFNSVRLPLLARAFLKEEAEIIWCDENFKILDQIIDWCEKYEVYVILDLHAACAGQSTVGCDDGVDNFPHLFMDDEGKMRTILLWKKIAETYKDKAVVAGYELLNEPLALPKWDNYIPNLLDFYDECIQEIRNIDQKHMIFLQGHRFAKRADIFNKDMDPIYHNWVLTFHIYETLPDLGLLGPILEERNRLNVPVWVGETGGSKHWLTVISSMLYEYHIGINIWCHKATKRPNAPTLCTYEVPKEFNLIIDYMTKGSSKPSYQKSIQIFNEYLKNVKFKNCEIHEEEANAILRKLPITIPAIGYDFKQETHKGNYPYCSFCGYRREDHFKMILKDNQRAYEQNEFKQISYEPIPKYGDYNHLYLVLQKGEYITYTIQCNKNSIHIVLDNLTVNESKLMIECCGHQYEYSKNNDSLIIPDVHPGLLSIRIICNLGTANFKSISIY